MNSTHAAVGVGGSAFGALLSAAIAGTWHIDPMLAATWVGVGSGVVGTLGALAVWFLKWKFPDAPPFPPSGGRPNA